MIRNGEGTESFPGRASITTRIIQHGLPSLDKCLVQAPPDTVLGNQVRERRECFNPGEQKTAARMLSPIDSGRPHKG
jgi:hypothetical protein